MMENAIHRWDSWKIRGIIILSLFLQILLLFIAPLRRATRNGFIRFFIWSAYLMASWVASFGIGFILQSLVDESNHNISRPLVALWAAFLLVHLGGPSTITALALEDNELWPRHLICLILQVAVTLYGFALLPIDNSLRIPTKLMFIAGVISYIESTRAMYLASLDRIRDSKLQGPNPGLNYDRLMEVYALSKVAGLSTEIKLISEPDNRVIPAADNKLSLYKKAYKFFDTFKGFRVDRIFERNKIRDFFRKLKAETALSIIELELKLIYELMYTKIQLSDSTAGILLQLLSFGAVAGSFGAFTVRATTAMTLFDFGLTLLMYLNVIFDMSQSLFRVYSDWANALDGVILNRIRTNWPKWRPSCCLEDGHRHHVLATSIFIGGWSGIVSGLNLIKFCLKGRPQKLHNSKVGWVRLLLQIIKKCSGFALLCELVKIIVAKWITPRILVHISKLRDTLESFVYVSSDNLTKELWTFIFSELKQKSNFTDDLGNVKKISMARGDWILQTDPDINIPGTCKNGFMKYVANVEYDESLMLWHIATELCYNHDKGENLDTEPERNQHSFKNYDYREFSKMLSDYMMYLLVMKPTMMSAVVGIGKIRFRDTCAEAERFFIRRGLKLEDQKEACDQILGVNTNINPANVKGSISKSVLLDACILAKKLIALENEHGVSKWMLLSKMWVEMMSYGAVNSRAYDHVGQLCKGGELITFVWLLMTHLGLGRCTSALRALPA